MGILANRIWMSVSGTPGTGTITLGSAISGFQSFAAAGIPNNAVVSYVLEDQSSGYIWEYGLGTFSGGTLARTTILGSSNSGSAISASSAATVKIAAIAATDVGPGTSSGYLNKFRNGNFDVVHRGTSGSVSSGSTSYTADGWLVGPTGAAAAWSQVYGSNLPGNSLKISAAAGMTACNVYQRVESYSAAEMLSYSLGLQTLVAQFVIYNGMSGSITPQIASGYANAQDNFGTVNPDLAATNLPSIASSSLALVSYTIGPGITAAQLSNGYQIELLFGGALNAASGFIQIGRADLRAVPGQPAGINYAPPPPELRDIHAEIHRCQRFYETSYGNGVAPATATSNGLVGSTTYIGAAVANATPAIHYKATKRAVCVPSIWDSAGNANEFDDYNTGFTSGTAFGGSWGIIGAGLNSFIIFGDQTGHANMFFHYAASCEL